MESPPSNQSSFPILVFTKTSGYRHASIPAGVSALRRLGRLSSPPFTVTHSEDAAAFFTPAPLARFRVVVLLHTSGPFLDHPQLASLRDFVEKGGGVVSIHGASTGMPPGCSPADPDGWYGRSLVGGVFTDHPEPQDGRVVVEDVGHAILRTGTAASQGFVEAEDGSVVWRVHDEWYNFVSNPREGSRGVRVLLRVDETSYTGGTLGGDHPIAWCRELDGGGRSFYTALGHFDAAYQDETFCGQLLNAMLWCAKVIS